MEVEIDTKERKEKLWRGGPFSFFPWQRNDRIPSYSVPKVQLETTVDSSHEEEWRLTSNLNPTEYQRWLQHHLQSNNDDLLALSDVRGDHEKTMMVLRPSQAFLGLRDKQDVTGVLRKRQMTGRWDEPEETRGNVPIIPWILGGLPR